MRRIKSLASMVIAVCALGAFGVASASALPLFVSKSGIYPQGGTFSGGEAKLNTTSGHEVKCTSVLGNYTEGLRLFTVESLYHKCTTTLFFSSAECNSPGEPKGLVLETQHAWLGYLTNATGEKMVGLLTQPESGSVASLFECTANAFEHAHIEILGEAVGAIPAAEINKLQKSFKIEFVQSSGGKQAPQNFLLPEPLSLMTGVHTTLDITGSISEKPEASYVQGGTLTLCEEEEGEIKG